ncbi:MAG: PKD domain-containing protein [Thermoplasmatota archaeon]
MPRLAPALLTIMLFAMGLPLMADSADAASAPIKFGMGAGAVAAQTNAGVKPDYGTFWIGPWTLSSGWAGPDGQLTNLKNAGVTPAIHFYYWGDDISPSCVENGCWSTLHNAQKDRAHWDLLASQLTDHLNSKMGGAPVLIFLESEFNKGGIETYEPFDGYMEAMAEKIHAAYPNAIVVLGFGNWGSVYWGNFDRVAAASNMVGIQSMRGSTRQSKTDLMTLYDSLLSGVKTLGTKFPGKAIMLTDVAVSSYPEPEYLAVQHDVVKEVFDNLGTLKAAGVQAIVYRSWLDTPTMDTANWYGEAERHWGFAWAGNGTHKPVAKVWIDGVKAERAGTSPTTTNTTSPTSTSLAIGTTGGVIEADVLAMRTAGGLQSDSLASGGKMWNLWSNGYVQQSFNVTAGDYTVAIHARGTPANGVAPHMDVTLGGVPLLSADPGTAYADFQAVRTLSGPVDLRITFNNDAVTSTEDRNLILDFVKFTPVAVNQAPVAAFTASTTGSTVSVDASASSDADGDALSYLWSFGDGATAVGAKASHPFESSGTFAVQLTVADGRGGTAASQQSITILPPTGSMTLDALGYKVKGLQKIDLTWTGATSTLVDIYRNSIKVTATNNDGSFTDALNQRGGGSYSYKVCETGTATCSPVHTVVF